jgi:hypothetical protein
MMAISNPMSTTDRLTLRCPQMSNFDAFHMAPKSQFISGSKTRSITLAKRLVATFENIAPHSELGDMQVWCHPVAKDIAHD